MCIRDSFRAHDACRRPDQLLGVAQLLKWRENALGTDLLQKALATGCTPIRHCRTIAEARRGVSTAH
eukprot:2610933-Rhodomonas_salina.1